MIGDIYVSVGKWELQISFWHVGHLYTTYVHQDKMTFSGGTAEGVASSSVKKRNLCNAKTIYEAGKTHEKQDFNEHIMVHTWKKTLKCDNCDGYFMFKYELKAHVESPWNGTVSL